MLRVRPLMLASVVCFALVLVNVAPVNLGLGGDAAFAKDDNAKGNGKGVGAAAANARGTSALAPGHNKTGAAAASAAAVQTTTKAPKTPGLDSELAGLHAANANLQAFKNASPNSKVGQLAAYAKAKVGVEDAITVRDSAQAALSSATTAKAAAQSAYDASTGALTRNYGYTDTSLTALHAKRLQLSNTLATTSDPAQRSALQREIAAVDTAVADTSELAAAQLAVARSTATLAAAQQNVANAQLAADTALTTAANDNRTPVDPAAKEWVDAQLEAGGVLDYYRGLSPIAPLFR
jgi:hypothetical protein